jgi:hypothetical protein
MTDRPSKVPDDPNPVSKSPPEQGESETAEPRKDLTPAARRALAEAEARRMAEREEAKRAKEIGGQDGPDPVRYGDWEKGGIAWDF